MISPMIQWDHNQDWFSGEYDEKASSVSCERKIILNMQDEESQYMTGHIIDGIVICQSNCARNKLHKFSYFQDDAYFLPRHTSIS